MAQATHDHLIELDLPNNTDGCSEMEIDVLIGSDFILKFMTGETRSGHCGPMTLKSIFG